MVATLTSTDLDNDRCPKCGVPIAGDTSLVCIPRAQLEALMAAAKALASVYRISLRRHNAWDRAAEALAALRAAGIDLSEPIKAEERR